MTDRKSTSNWRELEKWARNHNDKYYRNLAKQAFDLHDQEAMNVLVPDYDWFLVQTGGA